MDALSNFFNVFEDSLADEPDRALADLLADLAVVSTPWVLWISRPVVLGGEHEIPRWVTVSFAPGAVLTIRGRLTILGELDAGLETRFAVEPGGILRLLGTLDEIVANWWRSTGGLNPVEHALVALWTRYAEPGVLPAPIRLDGPYALRRTLRIKPSADVPNSTARIEVQLRGQWGRVDDPATFVVGNVTEEDGLSALVSVEEGVVLTMEHVAFHAGGSTDGQGAQACLSMEGSFHGSHLEACSFRYGVVGIRVSPRVQHWREVLAATGGTPQGVRLLSLGDAIRLSTASTNRLDVGRCVFVGADASARAIDVGLGAPTSLDVQNCQFTGTYSNAIAILGGALNVVACQFASDLAALGRTNEDADILVPAWDTRYELLTEHLLDGIDHLYVIATNPARRNIYRGVPLTNTHLTVTHCTSTSLTFLVMNQAFPYRDTALGGAVLTNVRHAENPLIRTSVRIGPNAPPRGLMLQGCYFAGSVVRYGGPTPDVIVNLGSVLAEG